MNREGKSQARQLRPKRPFGPRPGLRGPRCSKGFAAGLPALAAAAGAAMLAATLTAAAAPWGAPRTAGAGEPERSTGPRATASPPAAVTPLPLYAPYVAREDELVPATVTPTPSPAPTPIQGYAVHCQPNRTLEFCTWLSDGDPSAGSRITAFARLFDEGHPVAGATMKVQWSFPYPASVRRCETDTGPDGVAACTEDVPPYECQDCFVLITITHRGWPNQRQIRFRIH